MYYIGFHGFAKFTSTHWGKVLTLAKELFDSRKTDGAARPEPWQQSGTEPTEGENGHRCDVGYAPDANHTQGSALNTRGGGENRRGHYSIDLRVCGPSQLALIMNGRRNKPASSPRRKE